MGPVAGVAADSATPAAVAVGTVTTAPAPRDGRAMTSADSSFQPDFAPRSAEAPAARMQTENAKVNAAFSAVANGLVIRCGKKCVPVRILAWPGGSACSTCAPNRWATG